MPHLSLHLYYTYCTRRLTSSEVKQKKQTSCIFKLGKGKHESMGRGVNIMINEISKKDGALGEVQQLNLEKKTRVRQKDLQRRPNN